MEKKKPLLMSLDKTVYLEDGKLVIVDRRRLPREITPVYCRSCEDVAKAIEDMAVQGAGDIAVTAGYGLYLAALEQERNGEDRNVGNLEGAAGRLKATRPTGFHLALLLDNALKRVKNDTCSPSSVILSYIEKVLSKSMQVSRETGRHAETLLDSGDTILTHCFAGSGLLHMLAFARENGKDIRVFCTETRPYLQGARLTAWSVSELELETTLITDNMAAHFMSQGSIQKVFTAGDRIAMDGTVANKVGTLQLAVCARHFDIPFYILGYGGADENTLRGDDIPIEERDPEEILNFQGIPISGPDVKARYPAFDLTPPELVTGVITKSGVHCKTWR
jgi:methylthioribose-1-phosphate isomerase